MNSLEDIISRSSCYSLNAEAEDSIRFEENVCCSSNQNHLFSASMTFLQNHLLRKLKTEFKPNNLNLSKKTYSDLLIIENLSKQAQYKYYIRLKNIEEYDNILKKEARISDSSLSLSQILPVAKKNSKQGKSKIVRFFKTISKANVNLLCDSEKPQNMSSALSKEKSFLMDINSFPSTSSFNPNLSTNALTINRLLITPKSIKPNKMELILSNSLKSKKATSTCKYSSKSSNSMIVPNLIDHNINKFENLNAEGDTKKYNFSTNGDKINELTRCGAHTSLRKHLKINNLIENVCSSEEDEFICNYAPSFTNFTHELKSKSSSENGLIKFKQDM